MKERSSLRNSELLNPTQAAWFAGVFEIGASVNFNIQYVEGEAMYAYPYCQLVSKDAKIPNFMQNLCGGRIWKKGNSNLWHLGQSENVVQLISNISPYLVSRREICDAILNWENEDSEGRVLIAQEIRNENRLKPVFADDYSEIIQNPAFLAGVIDRLGHIRSLHKNKYPSLEIQSTNQQLLYALQKVYGGKIKVEIVAGTKAVIQGKDLITEDDSFKYRLSYTGTRKIISQALPYMVIKPYEEWNDSIRGVKREARNTKHLQIIEYIQSEMALFETGEIKKISTLHELAERFSVSYKTMEKVSAKLSIGIKEERLRFAYEKRMKLSPDEIGDIISRITNEIEMYKQGKISKLTTSEEWAEQLGNIHAMTFKKQVLGRLSKEARVERQKIITASALRTFSEAETLNFAGLIRQEVIDYQEGRIFKLKNNREWTDLLKTSLGVLTTMILPKIDREIIDKRTYLLRVQGNKNRKNK